MLEFGGITISKINEDKARSYAEFEVGPLPKGYGYTLGFSLRRVLLSSLPGTAITSVRINDIDHEFTTIPGVMENLLDVVLRLKNVRFSAANEGSFVITVSKKGKGNLTAGDLQVPVGVEVINKDFVIATLTEDSSMLNLEAVLETDVGYRRADENLRDEIGRIPVDALFSPVLAASPKVLPSRKGARTDLDKLILTLQTDGTITPEQAVEKSIAILLGFYTNLSGSVSGQTSVATTPEKDENMLDWKVADLPIADKSKEKMTEAGIKNVKGLLKYTEKSLSEETGLKAKSLKEVVSFLESYNLSLAEDEKES